jgi:hypothetical protein
VRATFEPPRGPTVLRILRYSSTSTLKEVLGAGFSEVKPIRSLMLKDRTWPLDSLCADIPKVDSITNVVIMWERLGPSPSPLPSPRHVTFASPSCSPCPPSSPRHVTFASPSSFSSPSPSSSPTPSASPSPSASPCPSPSCSPTPTPTPTP